MKLNPRIKDGFELFAQIDKGVLRAAYTVNDDLPIMAIGKYAINFGKCACDKIGLNDKNAFILAKKNDVFYISVNGLDSKIKGYKVSKYSHSIMRTSSSPFIKRGVTQGTYKILDPITINKIDWFELEPFEG